MIKVHNNIYVGMARMLQLFKNDNFVLLNVSSRYHYILNGWQKGNNYQSNPNYLTMRTPGVLSVNWIDAEAKFYNWQGKGVETFIKCLDFIEEHYKQHKVFIVCDQAISRSPSIALLFLAKRLHVIPDDSFEAARQKFLLLYPMYNPSGIADFIREKWGEIK